VSAMNKLANLLGMFMGQFPEAEKRLAEAERLAEQHQDKAGLSESYFLRCAMCTSVGDFDSVLHYMGQAAQYGHELGVNDQIVTAKDHVARTHLFMMNFDEAWQTAQETLQHARQIGNREIEAAVLGTIATYHMRNGDFAAARQAAEEMNQIAARIGSMMNHAHAGWLLGIIDGQLGDYERAVADLQGAVQAAFPIESFMPFMLVMPLATLGRTLVEISPALVDRAALHLDRARELLANPGGMIGGGTAWADIGFADLALGKMDEARENFLKGLTYPTMLGHFFKPQFWIGMAFVALAQHQSDDAAKYMADVRAFVQDRAMKHLYPMVAYADAQVLFASGENERALEQFVSAESLALEMKIRPMLWETRAGAAKVLAALGRAGEAEDRRRQARATVEEIAGLFTDQALRAAFVEGATRKLETS
jgi:tetratricopeptide (TPR) repeat protein